MLDRRSVPPLITPVLAAMLAVPVMGQTPDAPAAPAGIAPQRGSGRATPRPATESTDGNPGPIVTVEFPGGTVRQFVDAIRQAASNGNVNVNVIMPKEAESVPLPAISLRDVTAYTALQAIEFAANQDGNVQFSIGRLGKGEETSATFAVKFAMRSVVVNGSLQPFAGPPPKQETRVYSIRELVMDETEGMPGVPSATETSTETVLNAVKAASQVDTDAKSPAPELMLHKDSMLLIVRATGDQQKTIDSVLQQLTRSVLGKRARAAEAIQKSKAAALEQSEMQIQMDMNEIQRMEARKHLEMATDSAMRAKKLHAEGSVSDVEVQNAEAALVGARAAVEQAETMRRGLKEREAILKVRREAGVAGGASEAPTTVVYDVADLGAFSADVFGLAREVAALGRPGEEVQVSQRGQGTMVLQATPAQHRILVHALTAMRRAKANEPNLPGIDADALIRKGEQR